jgi:arginyl-tRNA synthetase
MYVIHEAKQQVLQEIKQAVGKGFAPEMADLEVPPDRKMGDLAFPCFTLAKKLKQSPAEIAHEIAAKIGPKGYIAEVIAVGPYVNVRLNDATFGTAVMEQVKKQADEYGTSKVGADKRVMVEFANLNTHKDVHIGHLRNLFVGQTAVNLLQANGYDVIPVAYINDLGMHVAKSVWAMKTYHPEEKVPAEERIAYLRDVYVEANSKLDEEPALKAQVSEVFRELEDQRGDALSLWKETRGWTIDYLREVYDELKLTIDRWYFESDLIGKTKKIIDGLIQDGIVVESEGAWIVDLEEEKLGVNLLIKSDGTLLYNAKDLGLAFKKEEDYHPLRSIYVVDARQAHALQQLFATLDRMGFDRELHHLAYDFVTLAGGAMASRKGNVIRYADFRDQLIDSARGETAARHEDWSEKQLNSVSRAIAFAAMRFGMLKQDVAKKIVFDMDDALSFEGFTGPYLLYTHARAQSLLKKAGRSKPLYSANTLESSSAHQLLVQLAQYPEVVFQSAQKLQPALLAQYLFDLGKQFSEFYANEPVLQQEGDALKERLGLVKSVTQVLQNGMDLLGIELISEM